jgi:hypothetical protein
MKKAVKRKKAVAGKAKTARKRTVAKKRSVRKSGSVKGGLMPAVKPAPLNTSVNPADAPVRPINVS